MSRKPLAVAFLIVLIVGTKAAWPLGQKMDVLVPVDALVSEKRYSEAIDMLRGLLVSAPRRTKAIKEKLAHTELLLADDEIASQRYNEALATLSLFWAQNPERADQAQTRIRKINQVREEYNKEAKSLLAFMSDAKNRADPNFNSEVAKRLDDLDKLDRNNPDSKKTIISLKETSTALVYQDSMRAVMSAGRTLIDGAQFTQALREYVKGFPLFRPEFEGAGYDDLTMQAVAGTVTKAEQVPDAFQSAQAGLAKALADLGAAFEAHSPERIAAALPAARTALDGLRTLRDSVFATGAGLARSFDALPKEGKSPIEYQYLAYLDIFLRGRPDSFGPDKKPESEKGKPEGMGGALLAQTEQLLDALGKSAQDGVDATYAQAEKAYDSGAYPEAQTAFALTTTLVPSAAEALGNWALIAETDFVPDLAALKAKIDQGAANQSRISQIGTLAAAEERLSTLAEAYDSASSKAAAYVAALTPSVALADARAALDGYRNAIRATEAAIRAELPGRTDLTSAAAAIAAKLGDNRATTAVAAYAQRLDKAAASASAAEYAVAAARGAVEGDYIARELAARTAAVGAADALTDGRLSTRPERERAGYLDPSPSAAFQALAQETPKLTALGLWISGDAASMGGESAALLADSAFSASRAKILDLQKEAAALQGKAAAALARASDKRKSAQTAFAAARADSDAAKARLADAKALITQDKNGAKSAAIKKDFADSKDRLEKALAGMVESSNQDFDSKSWDDFQQLYASMSDDLGKTRKAYYINETFRLLAEGQTYYEQGLFDLAAESLNGAQELWREDNDADQEQVAYWQNLVKQASDTNNTREVKPSDPLFYEIGNYLSEARKLYLQGDSFMKAGRKSDAGTAFESAMQDLVFVTRAFPLNAEAGFLKLQINKSTDLEAYRATLPRQIQNAVNDLAKNAALGYSEIADLSKMEPTNAVLKAALEKAEILVGKRRAPPTVEALAYSAAHVAVAKRLLATGRKDDAARAETELNGALDPARGDPANKEAQRLLRDLNTLKGTSSGPALGAIDQAILDKATREFTAGTYNQARDDLNKLLADPNKVTRDVLKLDNNLKVQGYP